MADFYLRIIRMLFVIFTIIILFQVELQHPNLAIVLELMSSSPYTKNLRLLNLILF